MTALTWTEEALALVVTARNDIKTSLESIQFKDELVDEWPNYTTAEQVAAEVQANVEKELSYYADHLNALKQRLRDSLELLETDGPPQSRSRPKFLKNMNDEKQFQSILTDFVTLVKKCESGLIDFYDLDTIPYLNQKKTGKIGEIKADGILIGYRFHGSGCSFTINNTIEIHYDVYINLKDYIVTSPWKLSRFIDTYADQSQKLTENEILKHFEALTSQSVVNQASPGYYVYAINLQWWAKRVSL